MLLTVRQTRRTLYGIIHHFFAFFTNLPQQHEQVIEEEEQQRIDREFEIVSRLIHFFIIIFLVDIFIRLVIFKYGDANIL